jgi:hypothetical protein
VWGLWSSPYFLKSRTEVVALGLPGTMENLYAVLDIFSKLKNNREFERQLNLRDLM